MPDRAFVVPLMCLSLGCPIHDFSVAPEINVPVRKRMLAMKKAVKIILIVIAVLAIAFFGLRAFTKSHSPAQTVTFDQGGLSVTLEYSRPYKKSREVFGGLVPYSKVWRTGANEATVIELGQDVKVAGKNLKAGKYSLWTIPARTDWTVIFNGEIGQWGTRYDEEQDVLRVLVPASKTPATIEQMNIAFQEAPGGTDMLIQWENTQVSVPIRK